LSGVNQDFQYMIENISEMQSNLLTLKKEISDSRESLKKLKIDNNIPLE